LKLFLKDVSQIKFVIKKSQNLYLVTIMYSAADYLEMIIIFGECERNAREAARVFEGRFPGRNDNYFFVCNTFFVFFATIRCNNTVKSGYNEPKKCIKISSLYPRFAIIGKLK
jgi:hypothetical protein